MLIEVLIGYGEVVLVSFPKDLVPFDLFSKVVDALLGCSGFESDLKFLKHLEDSLHRQSSSWVLACGAKVDSEQKWGLLRASHLADEEGFDVCT
ncbi:hypothetical protein ACLB2K_029740 [Fragaria x ananassa]